MDMSVEEIVRTVAREKGLPLSNFTVIMLERDRHAEILKTLRSLGVRIILIPMATLQAQLFHALQSQALICLSVQAQVQKQLSLLQL